MLMGNHEQLKSWIPRFLNNHNSTALDKHKRTACWFYITKG